MAGRRGVASTAVSRRRALLSLILAMTVGAQVVHGAPARATKLARALSCCAHHCPKHHPVSQTGARHCCDVQPADADTATPAASPLDSSPPFTAAIAIALPAVHAPAPGGAHELPLAAARAAPVFLLSRSLRL